jgi:hypothetical protein
MSKLNNVLGAYLIEVGSAMLRGNDLFEANLMCNDPSNRESVFSAIASHGIDHADIEECIGTCWSVVRGMYQAKDLQDLQAIARVAAANNPPQITLKVWHKKPMGFKDTLIKQFEGEPDFVHQCQSVDDMLNVARSYPEKNMVVVYKGNDVLMKSYTDALHTWWDIEGDDEVQQNKITVTFLQSLLERK